MARLSLTVVVLAFLATATATAADAPPVTLAQLPGRDGCLSALEDDAECTPIRSPFSIPASLAVSGDGRHVYLLSWEYSLPSMIHVFARNRFTGALTEDHCMSTEARSDCRLEPFLEDTNSLGMSPDRQHIYVIGTPTPEDGDDGGMRMPPSAPTAVVVFARNPTTGELTRVQCVRAGDTEGCEPTGELGSSADTPIVSPDGRHVYIGPALLDRDPATGRLSGHRCAYGAASDAGCPTGWVSEFAPDGRFGYERTDNYLTTYARDPATGGLTRVGCPDEQECRPAARPNDYPALFSALSVAPDGRNVYAAGWSPGRGAWVYDIDADPATGRLTERGCFHAGGTDSDCTAIPDLFDPVAVAAAPDGQAVYVPSGGSWTHEGGISMFARDPATGRLTWTGCITQDGSGGACVQGSALGTARLAAVSPDSRNVYTVSISGRIAVFGLAVDVAPEQLRVSERGKIRPRLICPDQVNSCDGRISFRRRGRTVAAKKFSIPGGDETRVRIPLSEHGEALLERRSRLRTTARLKADGLPGRAVRSVKITDPAAEPAT